MGRMQGKSGFAFPALRAPEHPWQRRVVLAIAVLLASLIVSTLGYYLIEPQYGLLESLYMSIITISTVGLGEVHTLSPAGRVWTIFVIICGVTSAAVVAGLLVSMFVEGQVRIIFGRRQLERKIANLSGHVVVCGYGRMGSRVAAELTEAGRDVVIVDSDPSCTTAAEQAGLLYVLGDVQEEAVLAAAGIERAEAMVAALPTDADNVFLTLSARQANRDVRIVARAQEASTQDKLLKAGATRVVCPQLIGASRLVDLVIRPAVVDFVEMAHRGVDLEMDQLRLREDSDLVGKTLAELTLPQRAGVYVVAVRRPCGEALYHPTRDLKLAAGDTLVLIGRRGVAAAVQKLQPEPPE